MGRKSKYETHVKPFLNKIPLWFSEMNEEEIAKKKLGIAVSTFNYYKNEHPELREALQEGRKQLVEELKDSLKKKAKGYYYTETKTIKKNENGKKTEQTEVYEKYAHPDTGAIHLLLKNLDETWRNDDKTTVEIKKKANELQERKLEASEW